jgi:PAS domain S-box-containing protein
LAYIAIAASLVVLLWKTRESLPFHWVFVAFGIFIVAGGFTHFFEMVTLWKPLDWLATSVKVLTAAASVAAAVAFASIVPHAAEAVRLFKEAYSRSEEQRVQTLSRLLDTEERMKLAMESSGFATWERSLTTKELYWDDRCRAIFGVLHHRKLYYEDFLNHIHPDERTATQALIESSLNERHEYDATFRIVRDDGEVRTVISRGRAFCNEDGQPVRLVGILIDITRERQAQEALLRSEKLAATGRLAASLAHEVNNPLAGAMNAIYIAKTMPDQASEMLKIAEGELSHAAHITQQTLGFYREVRSSNQEGTAHELVREVLSVYATKLQNRAITVEYRHRHGNRSPRDGCPDGCKQCERCFRVNAGEVRQIISNLLANGIDALSNRGVMQIRVTLVSHPKNGEPEIQLTMADNGHGIRTEHLKRIFEPFFTTKEEYGTGLGLWVTQELVRKHNGIIKVRSRTNKGTVFRITFPAVAPLAADSYIPQRAA